MTLSSGQAGRLAEDLFDVDPGGMDPEGRLATVTPQRIGRCVIRRLIATGGMGVVYEGEQENPRRTVAVKVMSHHLAARGRSALRRFEYEAEILARLDHPGIAKIFEAGSWDDGTGAVPYFVMEYIHNARSLTEYASVNDLGRVDRLELFIKVCDAVHYGHQRGIIHRDLKPANILISDSGGASQTAVRDAVDDIQPKVIDFGVARAADADISRTTMCTRPGDIVGTMQYMSPEQCAGDPHAIDIRADVYALGVTLFELLCGTLPYDLSKTPLPQAARIVQEQEASRPSAINRSLRGDLEAITLKAITKRPSDRYQSAADLARDLRHHLASEPIEARPPSIWSRMIRPIARHPLVSTAVASAAIVLFAVVAISALRQYLANTRPGRLELAPEGREARLVAVGGKTLHTWRAGSAGRITFAQILERPDTDAPRLIMLGFSWDCENPWRGSMSVFDVHDPSNALWTQRIDDNDLPAEASEAGVLAEGFGVSYVMIEDVFAENPGPEVIVAYNSMPIAVGAMAIYDLDGETLYRIWNDGGTGHAYWMGASRQLVVEGANAEVHWAERGFPGISGHPRVVFALRPRLGYISDGWTTTTPGGDAETLAWYQCLLPPETSDVVREVRLARPLPGLDRGSYASLNLHFRGGSDISWVVDDTGHEVADTRFPNNQWSVTAPVDADELKLGDLPPILSDARRGFR